MQSRSARETLETSKLLENWRMKRRGEERRVHSTVQYSTVRCKKCDRGTKGRGGEGRGGDQLGFGVLIPQAPRFIYRSKYIGMGSVHPSMAIS